MIVSAVHEGSWKHARSQDDVDQLLEALIIDGDPRYPSAVMLDDKPIERYTVDLPEYHLRVCSNPGAGYVALLFTASDLDPDRSWVSFNANPPLEDPHLAGDVDTDRYHDRFTAIPAAQAREALREYVRTGGQCPKSVTWVSGDYYGRITDRITVVSAA